MKHSTIACTLTKGIRISVAVVMLSGLLVITQPAQADVIIVTNAFSLRAAITQANGTPGDDTITFHNETNGIPIVLSGAAGDDANVSGDLDILNNGNLTINGNGAANTIIDGGGNDRVFDICPIEPCTNSVTLNGMTIRNGSVTDGGGGIRSSVLVNLQNSIIGGEGSGNSAGFGGGIYNRYGSTMTVYNTSVISNTAITSGGGIFTEGLTELNISDCIIGEAGVGNTAGNNGGGIHNLAGKVNVYGGSISNNSATDGGGIFNYEEGTLTVTDSTIGEVGAGNSASGDGGGIYNDTDSITTMVNSSVSSNSAGTWGGGIYNAKGSTTVDGGSVSTNTSLNGAGISNEGTLTVKNGGIIGGSSAGNIATNEGGGIHNRTGATATVTASTVSANSANYGGGIFNLATLMIFNNSDIGVSGAGNTARDGGGLNNFAGITTIMGSRVSANSASDNGGGVYNLATLVIYNSSTIGGAGAGNSAEDDGGGIYNAAGTTTVDGSWVSANTAVDGAGLYNLATLNIENGAVVGGAGTGNQASWQGGGIHNDLDGTTTVENSTVSANTANYGAGIYNGGDFTHTALVTIHKGSTIGGTDMGNVATNAGGGILSGYDSYTLVDDSTVSANKADFGAGIYNEDTLTVQNSSTIGGTDAGNQARWWGGGIYNYLAGVATITGSRILSNSATNGGAVYTNHTSPWVVSVTGSCIVNNSDISFFNDTDQEQKAPNNWWGAAAGPNTLGADTTGGNVTFANFLTTPILGCGYGDIPIYLPLVMKD